MVARLAGTLPAIQAAYDMLAAYAASRGITIGVADFGGVRTADETAQILQYRLEDYNAAIANGTLSPYITLDQFRPIAPFGQSFHNYGAAFDVNIIARPSSMSEASALATLGAYAPSIGLRWGGTFRNPDTPHFELAQSLSDVAAQYAAYDDSSSENFPMLDTATGAGAVLVGVALAVIAFVLYKNRH